MTLFYTQSYFIVFLVLIELKRAEFDTTVKSFIWSSIKSYYTKTQSIQKDSSEVCAMAVERGKSHLYFEVQLQLNLSKRTSKTYLKTDSSILSFGDLSLRLRSGSDREPTIYEPYFCCVAYNVIWNLKITSLAFKQIGEKI